MGIVMQAVDIRQFLKGKIVIDGYKTAFKRDYHYQDIFHLRYWQNNKAVSNNVSHDEFS